MGNYSHRIGVWTLVEALANRGHNITFFTNYKSKDPNPVVKEFFPKVLDGFGFAADINSIHGRYQGTNAWKIAGEIGIELCDTILSDPEVLTFITQNEGVFDLIIMDTFFCDCGLSLVYKYKVPHILFSTATPYSWQYDENGILPETHWIADITAGNYPENISNSLYYRILNTLHTLHWHFYKEWYYNPKIESTIRNHLNLPDFPSLSEIQKDVGLVFVNTHFSDEYARSIPPLYVPVGGIHCKDAKKLPEEIESFIRKSGNNGFIYVSLGSSAKLSHLPPETQSAIFNAMGNSSTSFLIKWNGDSIPNLPKNIFTGTWMPQQDILGHPKIRGFITHGGLLSIQEGICKGVPLIVLPVFGDQDRNAGRVHERGYGISMEILHLNQEGFQAAINSIFYNESYKLTMQNLTKIFHDRPTKPLDLAVWYTEYVLRHKKTPFLKSKGINQTWYQRRLIDVWFLILLSMQSVLGIVLFIIYKVSRCLIIKEVTKATTTYKKVKISSNKKIK